MKAAIYGFFSFIKLSIQIMTTTPATIEPPIIKAFPRGLPAEFPVVKPRNNKYADKTKAISESAFIIFIIQNSNAKNKHFTASRQVSKNEAAF